MSINIIRADVSHAESISVIGRQSFRDAFEHLFNRKDELHDYLAYTYKPEKLSRSISKENNIFFLAYIENVPVGFAKVKKFSLNDQIESVSQMELQKIYVLSYYHGSGAGAALMQAVIDLGHQLRPDFIWLDTYISNAKAIRFYEKHGFRKIGQHHFTIGTQTFQYHVMSLPVQVRKITNTLTRNNCLSD